MPTQNTLWSYLGISADQREYRQRANADSRLGQLRQRLLPNPRLATPSLAELQAPGAVGAASQVKLDRANAEKRMEAVKYLGTVDCHYWPEAEDALIGALRGDRNECVRLTAAQVLLNGCCCTKKVIKALTEATNGTDCDGFPAEKSERVRAAAQTALEKCLTCFCDQESKCPDKNCEKAPTPRPKLDKLPDPDLEKGADPKKPGEKVSTDRYYEAVAKMPSAAIIAEARKALAQSIEMDAIGSTINQADLIAAGQPGPFDAGLRSPKPHNLIGYLFSKPEAESTSVITERPLVAVKPSFAPMGAPTSAPPLAMNKVPPASKSMADNPIPQAKPIVVSADVPAVKPVSVATIVPPVKPVVVATNMPPLPPPVKPVVVATNVPPLPAPVKPVATPSPAASKSTPDMAGPIAPPKPLPTTLPAASKEDPAAKLSRMMKGLVPVTELTSAIDGLTLQDLRSHPALATELIAAGSRSANASVRLSTVQALVRCQVKTPEAMSVLQTAMQTDPDYAVRNAAYLGLKK
jgi:hypothetical protein